MDQEMDTSKMRVLLQGVVKIFKAGLRSKTWDIHGMPHFITTTHHEGCEVCEAYVLHVVEVSGIPTGHQLQGLLPEESQYVGTGG